MHPVINGMARAFWAEAYIGKAESQREDDSLSEDEYLPMPSAGGEWLDYVPEAIPPMAWVMAGKALQMLHKAFPAGIWTLLRDAAISDSEADEFGWYVAMQIMSHGVSWSDSHAYQMPRLPHIECSYFYFDDEDFYQ